MVILFEKYDLSLSSMIIQPMVFNWLIKFIPTSIPITVTGVANASAISAFSARMVTLFIPDIG